MNAAGASELEGLITIHLIDRRPSMRKKLDLRKISLNQSTRGEVTKLHRILSSWEAETQARKEPTYQESLDEENGWVAYETEKEKMRKKIRIKRGRSYKR